jgi:hypothetical protein
LTRFVPKDANREKVVNWKGLKLLGVKLTMLVFGWKTKGFYTPKRKKHAEI